MIRWLALVLLRTALALALIPDAKRARWDVFWWQSLKGGIGDEMK